MMAYAFGGKKSRRRFCGCLDALSFVRFRARSDKFRRYFCLEEGQLIDSFFDLKRNSARLGMAVNCALFFSTREGNGDDNCDCGDDEGA